jgi:hypothetical protein
MRDMRSVYKIFPTNPQGKKLFGRLTLEDNIKMYTNEISVCGVDSIGSLPFLTPDGGNASNFRDV